MKEFQSHRLMWISGAICVLIWTGFPTYIQGICTDAEADQYLTRKMALSGVSFWHAKVDSVKKCAAACLRVKKCLSFNYHVRSGECEFNSETLQATSVTRSGKYDVYSNIADWPDTLDPECSSRPCADDEVCVPGKLTAGGKTSSCSYSCMPFLRLVCPMVSKLSGGRRVGDVNSFKCPTGYVGGGEATCLPNLAWSNNISFTCTLLLGHTCTNNLDCEEIDAKCMSNVCNCTHTMSYNASDVMCIGACGIVPNVANAVVSGDEKVKRYSCKEGYFPTSASETNITCNGTSWTPTNRMECYTCVTPPSVPGADIVPVAGRVRNYECSDGSEPVVGTNSTLVCLETEQWDVDNTFACTGVRLVHGNNENFGRVEIFFKGSWMTMKMKMDMQKIEENIRVICRNVNPKFRFGGSYHPKKLFDEGASTQGAVKLDNMACTGNEEQVILCPKESASNDSNHGDDFGVTCYTESLEGAIRVSGGETQYEGRLEVKFDGKWGVVCKDGFDKEALNAACKSINSAWLENEGSIESEDRDYDCKTDELPCHVNHVHCEDGQTNLFYCKNAGWGEVDDCKDIMWIKCQQGS